MMPTSRSRIATLLLNSISEEQRISSVRQAAQALTTLSDDADFSLVAALLQECYDESARTELVNCLRAAVVGRDTARAVSLCKDYPEIGQPLFDIAIAYVTSVPDRLRHEGPKWLAIPIAVNEEESKTKGNVSEPIDTLVETLSQATAYLHFLLQVSFDKLHSNARTALFKTCCTLVGATDEALSTCARDIIAVLLKSSPEICTAHSALLWACICSLITSKEAQYQQHGHFLWLRWIASSTVVDTALLQDPLYWKLLKDGLRFGDPERRKSSLQVFKASIDLVVDDPSLIGMVTNREIHVNVNGFAGSAAETVRQHYARFSTVFETVALSRYINQVQECEADFDFLSSSQSMIKPEWFLTLLESALDPAVQDSIRKFVGSWIMRSTLQTDDWMTYISFFRDSFLPWAIQGHLFTSSLRAKRQKFQCLHGEGLSEYVRILIERAVGTDFLAKTVDAILQILLGRGLGKNFAYAKVYLLHGLGESIQENPSPVLDAAQVKQLEQLLSWTGLPEITRDYVYLRYAKILHDLNQRDPSMLQDANMIKFNTWNSTIEKIRQLGPDASAQSDGSVASWYDQLSKRDVYERNTIQKCQDIVSNIKDGKIHSSEAESIDESLNDVWSEVEYLEQPKDLLIVLPRIVLHPSLVSLAVADGPHSSALALTISKIVKDLAELSKNRAYLLSPLIESVRLLILQDQSLPFDLDDLILQFINQPATPSLDARLEDSVATLIQCLGAGFERMSYEYYFGRREGYGTAALLDLVSRLSSAKSRAAGQVLNRVLGRWVSQKTPPPTVSQWKNVVQLQTMLLCAEQVVPNYESKEAEQILRDLHYVLSIEHLPRYRFLFEWMVTRVYIHHKELQTIIFDELRTKDHHSNPKFLASLMKIGVRVAKSEEANEEFAAKLANVLVSLAASSKIVIRHEAQWQLPMLRDHAVKHSWTTVTGNDALLELDEFLRSLDRYDDPPRERQIDIFDPVTDHTMTNLVEGSWFELDDIEQPFCRHEDFEKLFTLDASRPSMQAALPPPCLPLGSPVTTLSPDTADQSTASADQARRILQNIDNISRALGSGPGPIALQTKGNAYLESQQTRYNHLIVVSSLVDNPYNLGGLSRVSEIFGASAMYLQSLQVTGSKDFTNVSVSSHLHLPMYPLPAAGVPQFLARQRKEEGFVVVGIEQTDRSVLLGSPQCLLPEKCILVIGSERLGIPALVLSECDILVEIPQVGITRSLNVQTAAGIVLCEYVKQHKR